MTEEKNNKIRTLIVLSALFISSISITWNLFSHASPGCYAKIFTVGSSICHQLPSHSFNIDSLQFPVCARCAGLYLGSFIGITYGFFSGKKKSIPDSKYLVLLLVLFILWAGDGINSLLSDLLNRPFLYQTTNTTRLITGYGMGLVMSTALVTLFNITIWQRGENKPLIENIYQIMGYVLLTGLSSVFLRANNLVLFQVAAYITIFTAIVIISLLYTIFWVIIWKKENQFNNIKGLFIFLLLGFCTAMGQILLFVTFRSRIL